MTHYIPGALHMHTVFSDGSGTVADLARAAREAGLRWIIITDHDTLEARPSEGWIDGVLVIVGHEITPDRNHFLALNLDDVVSNQRSPREFVDEVYARGGFGIIAHPDERVANDFKEIYRWEDWTVDGPSERGGRPVGIELWNVMSDWGEQLTPRNKELSFFFPRRALSGPTSATLTWWDRLNREGKRTFGVGGVDAHAFKKQAPWGETEVFSYRWMFGTLTNYLLLDAPLSDDAPTAIDQVYAALAAGRHYFVNRLDGDCPALTFEARRGGEQWTIGATVPVAGGPVTFAADCGANAELRLLRDGQICSCGRGALRETIAHPGVYRLEGYRRGRPWLFTNPIYLES